MNSKLSMVIFVMAAYGLSILPLNHVAAQDDNRSLRVQQGSVSEHRVALVIGNAGYNISPLTNPINDARDIAAALREVGFDVTLREDLNQRQMKEEILAFGKRLRNGGIGLFYFAGHGIQVDGRNYLVPIDAKIDREEDVEFEAVDAGRVLAEVTKAENSLNLIILDACRNNPFARSFRSSSRGLAYMSAPSGTLIAYSTAPGSVASDGAGHNGLYTEELLKNIRQPGLRIEDVFKRVRVAVRGKTNGLQIPWESVSLEGDFYFIPTAASNPDGARPISSGTNGDLQTYTETINRIRIEMVRVPAGRFLMGSPVNETGRVSNEGPQHEVSVSSFYMGKYEVTQAQWRAVAQLPKVQINLNPNPSDFKGDNLPVEQVTWGDAVEFCDRLSRATGKTYRLPTEAEWEYAARAMTTGPYAGNLDEVAWYGNNAGRTRIDTDELWKTDPNNYYQRMTDNGNQPHPVGQKRSNGFGLYDMHGNVWEWCNDWYSDSYYNQSPLIDPQGPSAGTHRIRRGGSWSSDPPSLRAAIRLKVAPGDHYYNLGFRIARTSN